MLLQITKYLFKYLQNSFLAEDVVFMKNWDISTAEFKSLEISPLFDQFPRDSELILYISYVCKLKLSEIEKKFKLSGPEELLSILKSLLYKSLNNNLNLTKVYKPIWERHKLESFFKSIELKNVHSSELMKNLIEIKQNPKGFLQNPESFFHKVTYKLQYNSPPYNSPLHSKSPISKLNRYYSENPNAHLNEFGFEERNRHTHDRKNSSRSRSRSRSKIFRSFRSFGNLKDSEEGIDELIREEHPPVESFVNTQDFFISALNDCKGGHDKYSGLNNSNKGLKIKEQIDEDNKTLDEKRNQFLNTLESNNPNKDTPSINPIGIENNNASIPESTTNKPPSTLHSHNLQQDSNMKKKSNEKQQPSHKSVLLRINNEHKTEKSQSKKSDSSSKSSSVSSVHRKKKKRTGSNESKSKKSKKIKKHNSVYYSSFSKKKNSGREEDYKYLIGDISRGGTTGGHYERQLLKKYKGEKLAEFIEKASGAKTKDYPTFSINLFFFQFLEFF